MLRHSRRVVVLFCWLISPCRFEFTLKDIVLLPSLEQQSPSDSHSFAALHVASGKSNIVSLCERVKGVLAHHKVAQPQFVVSSVRISMCVCVCVCVCVGFEILITSSER